MKSNLKANSTRSGNRQLRTLFAALLAVTLFHPVTAFGAAGDAMSIPSFPELEKSQETIDREAKLEAEGEQLFKQHLLDKALIKWQEAYGMSIEMKFSEGEGRNLTNMCRIFIERGQFPKAKYMGENAVEVLAGIADKRDLGRARVALARAYFGLDNPEWASQQLAEALKIFTQESNSASPDAADLLCLSAQLMIKAGKIREALRFYDQAAIFYLQSGEQMQAVTTHVTLSNLMDTLGLYVAAAEESAKAVAIAKNITGPNGRLSLLTALASQANTQYILCEFANARSSYEQCIQIASTIDAKDLDANGRSNIDLGYGAAIAATGDLEQARIVLERSMPGMRKAGGMVTQAGAYNMLGVLEARLGQSVKALAYLNQSLDMQQVLTPKQDKLHVLVLQNLAAVQASSGDFRAAKSNLATALTILKKYKNPLLETRTMCSLAELAYKSADVQNAEAYLKQAIPLAEKIKDDSSLWRDYTLLARIQIGQDNAAAAKDSLNSALSFFRSPQAGPFPSPERLNFPTSRQELGQQLVAVVAKQGMAEQALLTAEQLKEEAFNDEWHSRGGLVRPEDRDIYNDLVTQRAHLHAAENASQPDKLVSEWQAWLVRFNTLVSQNRNLARMIAPVPNTVVDVVKAVQARHATIVEYLVAPEQSVIFTVDPSGRISSTVLPTTGSKRLQSQVSALLAPLSGDPATEQTDQRERVILQALYNELIPASVRGFIPKSPDQMVVIIPDGVLFNLPFAALVDTQGKYLIENHLLTMAPSMGGFLDSPPKYADDLSVLIASQSPNGMDDSNLISQILEPTLVTKLSGRDADISSIQENGRGKAVVHITTNTPLSGSNPMRSIIPIAPGKDDTNKRVTADRLFVMNIPSDLMVMSASSVNVKDVKGSAVEVFSRGLSYAGVRNVLMSLWVEPDNVRAHELVEFYRGKQEGLNQAQSLRKAEMLALAKDPSPRAWAAFQLLGPGF